LKFGDIGKKASRREKAMHLKGIINQGVIGLLNNNIKTSKTAIMPLKY